MIEREVSRPACSLEERVRGARARARPAGRRALRAASGRAEQATDRAHRRAAADRHSGEASVEAPSAADASAHSTQWVVVVGMGVALVTAL